MKIRAKFLELHFRKATETITFDRVNFFWGKIGAGKSSIARLIDYCLGADINLTPALQLEFVQAALGMEIDGRDLTIYRDRGSNNVVASWRDGDETIEVLIPARKANGIAVPGTPIEVLSDLLFYLAKIPLPYVRKGRASSDPSMVRLSLRDLIRFCYIDQDDIDSDFFRLDMEGDWIRRAKSIDAMRFILGYHQDRVAALESQLQAIHENKMAAKAAAEALAKVLEETGFSSPVEIDARVESLSAQRDRVREEANAARKQRAGSTGHAVDSLRDKGRLLSQDISDLAQMRKTIQDRLEDTERHVNELKMLSVRFNRTKSARALLAAVDFKECPRCNQSLPIHEPSCCSVCGQPENIDEPHEHLSDDVIEADVKARLSELQETLIGLRKQGIRVERELERGRAEKASVDQSLDRQLRDYDSAFLSQALEYERQATIFEQQIGTLISYRKLPERLAELLSAADTLQGDESELRATLARERESAFKDRANLEHLEKLFLDCLVRSSFPGIDKTYKVTIDPRSFVPEVFPTDAADFAVTSFANMGSGGMKTIFKACYALALHRLAAKIDAPLPAFLVLDSAMKNVSERENRELFQAFYKMVYELAANELRNTQFILIDKEMFPVPTRIDVEVRSRHMAPGSREHPPLVPYYKVPDD